MPRLVVLLALLWLPVARAMAAETVDVALVLVDDVSGSINDEEFDTQKRGYHAAFTDPKVLAAIQGGAAGQIAIAYVEFASDFQVRTVLPWTIIKDAASAKPLPRRCAPRRVRSVAGPPLAPGWMRRCGC